MDKPYYSLLCRALLYMCHIQRSGRKTVFQQPIPTTIIPFPPAQKGSAHQVTNELRLLTSFSEAGLSFPDQYLKLKSSSVCQPSLLLHHFAAQISAAPGSSQNGLWCFSFGRQDSKDAVQGQHLLTKWIPDYTHDLSQKVILPKVPPGVLVTKASMVQQSPRLGIGSSSAVTAFEPNLTFFLPSWPVFPQKPHTQPRALLEPFFSNHCNVLGSRGGTCPKVRGRRAGPCHSCSCELAVNQGRKDTKGLRHYQKVTATA